MPTHLFGDYFVKRVRPAICEAGDLFPRARDYFELRSHVLKLAFWPGVEKEGRPVVDINWSWIKGLKGKRVGELRIGDEIGGHENLRVIFFVPRKRLPNDPLPRIWILCVMAKKRRAFSKADAEVFDCRRALVVERYYSDSPVVPSKRRQKRGRKTRKRS
jgi:hypothetical protein